MTSEWQRDQDYLTLHRLLRNEMLLPGQAQVGYVMAETSDNQSASLKQASQLLQNGIIEKIALADPLPPYDFGYPGPNYCKQILLTTGVQENQIITARPDKHIPHMNTQTELAILAEHFKKIIYTGRIVIIAPWFHILRAYITVLSEFKSSDLNIKVFASSVSLPPFQVVKHSQGIQKESRRKIFYEEVEKCQSYNNLMPIGEILEIYRKQRVKDSN